MITIKIVVFCLLLLGLREYIVRMQWFWWDSIKYKQERIFYNIGVLGLLILMTVIPWIVSYYTYKNRLFRGILRDFVIIPLLMFWITNSLLIMNIYLAFVFMKYVSKKYPTDNQD